MALVLVTLLVLLVGWYFERNNNAQTNIEETAQEVVVTPGLEEGGLNLPIAEFKDRITRKPFGLYVNPKNSPVSPEVFTGYHTAVDIEYDDVATDVPVYAIADGEVVLARTASGYGGVMIIKMNTNGTDRSVVYGHLRPSSLPNVGQRVTKGEQIGVLGTGYTSETDNERRHLHFGVLIDTRIDLKGYVQTETELSGWIDPLTLY